MDNIKTPAYDFGNSMQTMDWNSIIADNGTQMSFPTTNSVHSITKPLPKPEGGAGIV